MERRNQKLFLSSSLCNSISCAWILWDRYPIPHRICLLSSLILNSQILSPKLLQSCGAAISDWCVYKISASIFNPTIGLFTVHLKLLLFFNVINAVIVFDFELVSLLLPSKNLLKFNGDCSDVIIYVIIPIRYFFSYHPVLIFTQDSISSLSFTDTTESFLFPWH